MTVESAVFVLASAVENLEPGIPCECLTRAYPRLSKEQTEGGVGWRPGLRWSDEAQRWRIEANLYVAGKRATPPSPRAGPEYVPCEACDATGVAQKGDGPIHRALAVVTEALECRTSLST